MKKIFTLILLACLGTGWGYSQSIQLIMSPRPSCYFSDWQNKTETIRLIVNNTSKASIDCKIKTQLFNSKEEKIGETDVNKMPVLTVEPGISQFNAEDIYPLDAIRLFGNSLSSMLKTGRIPEDNYRLCTDLVDPEKGTSLTQGPQCKMFSIIAFQAPVLLTPREDESIPEAQIRGVIFKWTPVTPSSNVLVTYRFQVWEVLDGQTKADACRNNQPIVEKDFRGILQTQWPVDFALPGIAGGAPAAAAAGAGGFSIQKYVWSITPYDDQDRKLVIDGYGMAEPFGFDVIGTGVVVVNYITVKLTQPPPNQLRLEDLNIQLTNNAKEPTDVSLRGTVTLTSNADTPSMAQAAVKPKKFIIGLGILLKPFSLPPGSSTFTYDKLETGNIKFSSDEWAKAFGPGGVLPPGDYEICVSVLDKSGKEIGKGCIDQKIASDEACKDFSVVLMDYRKIYSGDSGGVEPSITNKYRGDDPRNKPRSFRIKIQNDIVVEFADNVIKGWTRTPSKFPPGSSSIKWTNNSGDIPNGETKFGRIGFVKGKTSPFTLEYEWLNKDDKVICSGTIDLPGSAEEKKKFAFRWKTNYRVERSDILDYLQTQEVFMRLGDYPFDYSTNPNGDVRIPLAKPIPDKGIDKAGMMFAVDCSDETCKKEGEACYGNPGGNKNCLITPVIENGLITKLILSFTAGKVIFDDTNGSLGTIELMSPVGHGGTGDEGSGEEGDLVTFKWSAPDIKGPFFIRIVELKESQSPDEAMQKNKAFFEQKGIEGTSFKYPGSAPKFEPGKRYAWMIKCGDLQSSISIYDRWGIKIAYSWETDYRLDNADILGYLRTDEVIIKKGKYLFDYSTNPNGDVTLPLAIPIRDNRLADPEVNPELSPTVMFEGVPADIDCAKDGSSCVGGPRSTVGKPSYYTVKAGIVNGFIFQIILSYKAANSGQNGNSGDAAVGVKINPPAPNQLKLSDLTNFTLTNGILKPLEVVLSCTLTSTKPKPILIIIIILRKFNLPPGPTTFTPDDFKSGDVKFASDEWSQAFGPNGKVPAGDYTLCVSVQDRLGTEIGKDCIEQKIVGGDDPQLISPKDDLPPTSNRPTFEWKTEKPVEGTSYSIVVRETPEVGEPENGVMVLERSNIREITLPYPKNSPSLDPAKSYGWQLSWFKNGKLVGRTPFTRFSFSKFPGN